MNLSCKTKGPKRKVRPVTTQPKSLPCMGGAGVKKNEWKGVMETPFRLQVAMN